MSTREHSIRESNDDGLILEQPTAGARYIESVFRNLEQHPRIKIMSSAPNITDEYGSPVTDTVQVPAARIIELDDHLLRRISD